jgi:hypothetical protein
MKCRTIWMDTHQFSCPPALRTPPTPTPPDLGPPPPQLISPPPPHTPLT